MENTTTDYEKQGTDFLAKTNTIMTVKFLRQGKYFEDDKNERDIYEITLKRGNREFTFTFGQSLIHSGRYVKYGKPERGISQGYKTKDNLWHAPIGELGMREWSKNKDFQVPRAYDVLASLEKYDVGTFEDFCSEFGYDTDSRKAEKTYQAVKEQFTQLQTLFNDAELADMAEIN